MQMRVRGSLPIGKLAVRGKGSAFIDTDSKATARVFVAWLSSTGFLLVAAFAAIKLRTRTQANNESRKVTPFAAQQGKLVFITDSVAISVGLQ